MISDDDRRRLLAIARAAIVTTCRGADPGQPVRAVAAAPIADNRKAAAFVTLHKLGELRGCIGHLAADLALDAVVARCAVASATEDPRFPAVTASEVDALVIEISVLGPLEPIRGPAEIEVGRHGLVVEQGWARGLLLPQVATEWNWDAETFLAQTCRKAGLPADAWRHGAKVFRFEAEVFGE